jgi:subtilisin family serine protease
MWTRSAAVLTSATMLLAVPGVVWSAPAPDQESTRIVTVSRQPDGGLDIDTRDVGGRSIAAAIAQEAADPDTLSVEIDSRVRASGVITEPLLSEQWGIAAIRADAAWEVTQGAGVTVAVLDTGVDAGHEDLAGQVLAGVDLIGNQTSGDSRDQNGHGTHVAGIIAAADNALGAVGVAPAARILPVRVLDAEGAGYAGDVAEGIVWAVDHGAAVINLSLGGPRPSAAQHLAIQYAVEQGVSVFAAAGNSGPSAVPEYPAAFPEVTAVGATTPQGLAASFSSRGSYVDLAAPGTMILAAHAGGGYAFQSGSSMASPFAAGVASLVLGLRSMSASQMQALLMQTAVDVDAPGTDTATGAGLICAQCAVEAVRGPRQAEPPDVLEPAARGPAVDESVTTARPVSKARTTVRFAQGKRAVVRGPKAFSGCEWSKRTPARTWRSVRSTGCRLTLGKARKALHGSRFKVEAQAGSERVSIVFRLKITRR